MPIFLVLYAFDFVLMGEEASPKLGAAIFYLGNCIIVLKPINFVLLM